MKTPEEILRRIIILQTLIYRCDLKDSFMKRRKYSYEEREQQRKIMYDWLKKNGYYSYMTDNEKLIFETNVDGGDKNQLTHLISSYKSLKPLLWSIDLFGFILPCDNNETRFIIEHYAKNILNLGDNFDFQKLLSKSKLKSQEKLDNNYEKVINWESNLKNNHLNIKITEEVKLNVYWCVCSFEWICSKKDWNEVLNEKNSIIA